MGNQERQPRKATDGVESVGGRYAPKAPPAPTGGSGMSLDGDYRDADGFDSDGYGRDGFGRNDVHWATGLDRHGYSGSRIALQVRPELAVERPVLGFNEQGYDRFGFDDFGFDSAGYNRHGFDDRGRDRKGYDIFGVDSWEKTRNDYKTPVGVLFRFFREMTAPRRANKRLRIGPWSPPVGLSGRTSPSSSS